MNIKVPVSWLREYLKTDAAAKTIANLLSASGPTVERIEKAGEDYIFNIEATSNRPDAASILGIAREAHAILTYNNYKSELVLPSGLNLSLQPDSGQRLTLDAVIKNQSLSRRFSAIIVDNVKIKPSPAFIKKRLAACGIRAINNIVDISNYIMLEAGQPMHTFDYDKIKGAKMVLRESFAGEKITTIDKQTRKLPKGAIVIEDAERLIDLCGIMGGANSQINTRTKRVLFFVQSYDPLRIRKTTQALAFHTEAALRFEKGVDLEGILPALSRAIYLAKKTAGARIASELIDIYHDRKTAKTVTLNFERLNGYLGVDIKPEMAANILTSLGFGVSPVNSASQSLLAQAPSARANDIEIEEDLIEEIARIYGYQNLPAVLPQGQTPQGEEGELAMVIRLKGALKYLGLSEIISYSIISREFLGLSHVRETDSVELANPLSSEWQFMRPTILISLVDVIAKNQSFRPKMQLFEIAKTYKGRQNEIPLQDLAGAFVIYDEKTVASTDAFYKIKGLCENVFEILRRTPKFQKVKSDGGLFEKSLSSEIKIAEDAVGRLGILNSEIHNYFGLSAPVAACEINLSAIYRKPANALTYKPVAKYPPVIEDISVIVDQKVLLGDLVERIKNSGGELIFNVLPIDIFEDEKFGRGKKSVTIRLIYQKASATPTQEEVLQTREKVIVDLVRTLGAQIRR